MMDRESSHWMVAAWVAGLILILTMAGGGLFLLAWHDVQDWADGWYQIPVRTRFYGIRFGGRTATLLFEVMLQDQAPENVVVVWNVWPFRDMASGVR